MGFREQVAGQQSRAADVAFGSSAVEMLPATLSFMSASPRKRTSGQTSRYVRLVPIADICSAANCALFDHLVGAAYQGDGEGKAECPGGLKIDDKFDLRGLLDWQVGGLLAP